MTAWSTVSESYNDTANPMVYDSAIVKADSKYKLVGCDLRFQIKTTSSARLPNMETNNSHWFACENCYGGQVGSVEP